MTIEAKAPSAFQRAEGGARHAVLQVGLGVVGFIVGGLLTAGATARLAERIGPVDSEAAGFALGWVLQRLWLFVVVPLFGWAVGRFTELRLFRFAVTACLAGEVFALLLATAINGFEAQVAYPPDVLARLVTLILGMAITLSAGVSGRRAARDAQLEADALAAKRKAEYAEFLEKAEKR